MNHDALNWLREMAVFARVVEAGGFGRAAVRLGMSTPAVSKQVSRLEAGLGVKLLHRSTRAMSLTDAGRAVYAECARMLQAAEAAETAAGHLVSVPRGGLRLSAPVAFGQRRVLPWLPGFLARYPEIRVELVLLDRCVDLAEEGFDLVLRLTDQPPESLAARPLGRVAFTLCAAPAYLARHLPPQRPEELAGHNCIRQGAPQVRSTWRFIGAAGESTVRVSGNVAVGGGEEARQLLLAGVGCGVLPDYVVADDLAAGQLCALLPDWRPLGPFNQIHALYLPNRQGDSKLRACIDDLLARLWAPGG